MPAKGSDETNRERRVTVLFTNNEFQTLAITAHRRKMTISELIRDMVKECYNYDE